MTDIYVPDADEMPPCLICGNYEDPCDCQGPIRIVTLTVEVRAESWDAMPTPDGIRDAICDSLPEAMMMRGDGDLWYIYTVGYPNNLEVLEDYNCPEKEN